MLTLNSVSRTEAEACLVPLVPAILPAGQGYYGNSVWLYKQHHQLLCEGRRIENSFSPTSVLLPRESYTIVLDTAQGAPLYL